MLPGEPAEEPESAEWCRPHGLLLQAVPGFMSPEAQRVRGKTPVPESEVHTTTVRRASGQQLRRLCRIALI